MTFIQSFIKKEIEKHSFTMESNFMLIIDSLLISMNLEEKKKLMIEEII
jgi:hypothetical protein